MATQNGISVSEDMATQNSISVSLDQMQ